MKTQVIHLDVHDDVISIRDKMSWTKTGRILLVFPRRSRIRLRNLDLRLIQRHADLLGAQLAFVTRSRELRRSAQEAGIPAFRVVKTAQRRTWGKQHIPEKPQRQAPPPDLWQMRRELYSNGKHWQNLPAVRISFFTFAVLTVVVLLVLFLPTAVIQLTPTTKLQNLTISVYANPNVATVNLTGSIPAHSTTMFIEQSKTAKATGMTSIPNLIAAGKVRFRNLTSGIVGIPAGTIVRTTGNPPVQFSTTQEASLPATAGKTVEVPVKAVVGGNMGNLPVDALVLIEGDLGASLAVTNPAPTTGGTDRKVPAPTAADRRSLHDALQAEILSNCKAGFLKSLGAGTLLFPDTLKVSQAVSETYFPAADQSGDTLSLTMNLQCQMQYTSAAELNTLAEMAMDVNVPEGFEPAVDSAIASVADVPKTDADGTTHWKMQTQRLLRNHLNEEAVLSLVQGRRPATAAQRLSAALPLETWPDIKLTPTWWPWLPVFPFRISVVING